MTIEVKGLLTDVHDKMSLRAFESQVCKRRCSVGNAVEFLDGRVNFGFHWLWEKMYSPIDIIEVPAFSKASLVMMFLLI
jgi:hypothetical protein